MKRHIHRPFAAGLVVLCAATAARADVTGSGDFQTSVPIDVPTMRGVSPTVRLAYAANAPNGIAGVGWSLDATSAISRTGPRGGLSVAPAAPDGFELDGEPLIPCAPNSTSPSCTTALVAFRTSAGFYSTRRESFARIQYDSATDAWNVWSTSGHVSRYVTHDGGQRWLLESRADRHGNALRYNYNCAAGAECELASINYGDRERVEVRFHYEARPDILRRSNGNATLTVDHRLRSIVVTVDSKLARAYELGYATAGRGAPPLPRSILETVTQHASDATVDKNGIIDPGPTPALPPITFTMGGGAVATRTTPIVKDGMFSIADLTRYPAYRRFPTISIPNLVEKSFEWGEPKAEAFQTQIGDFDGDARTDFINVYISKKCQSVGVSGILARKNGNELMTPREIASFPSTGSDCVPRSWVADIDGDHRDDLITKFRDQLFVSRFNGKSFRVDPVTTPWTVASGNCSVGDVDGDLRDDLLCLVDQSGLKLVTARSRGDATWNVTTLPLIASGVAATTPFAVGDINNDGLADAILAPDKNGMREIVTLTSYGHGYTQDVQTTQWTAVATDRLTATDVDGDGLGDLVLNRTTGYDELALAIEGAWLDRYELRTLATTGAKLGDVDGDGRVDLVNGHFARLGDGTGGFSAPVAAFPPNSCTAAYLTDTDGDGRTEHLCVIEDIDEFVLDDDGPTVQPRDVHRWMSGDVDGDGRIDYVYPYALNPGVGVRTVLTSSGQRVAWQQLPTAAVPGLDDSSAAHWILTDVGGPNRTPDGLDDLVMVDTDAGQLRVYTMFSKGDGTYTAAIDNTIAIQNAHDLGNYWPLDVDGNGMTDLVHLAPSPSGVRVDLLQSQGNGEWAASSKYYFTGATPKIVGATSFKPVDINGDGLTDLVHMYSGAGITGTAIRVLVNRGDGSFGEVSNVIAMTYPDTSRWMPLDVNGDGTTDLVHATSTTTANGSGMVFESLLSRGDGVFTPGILGTVWLDASANANLRRALESTAFLMPADLDGDRDLDFWHISQYRDASGARRMLFVELLNTDGGAQWQVAANMPAMSASAPWAWRSYRDASRKDGAGLALIDGNAGLAYIKDLPSDRIARIDNGTGGATTIEYAPLLASRTYLPSGSIPIVVTEVAKHDSAYSPVLTARTSYRYSYAQYSHARGGMNFGWIEVSDPRTTIATNYAVDDACGGTPLRFVTYDSATMDALAFKDLKLVAPGDGPFTCLVQQEVTYGCGGGTCQQKTVLDVDYDQFGNVAKSRETAADAPTRYDYAPVYENNEAYVVDLPMSREVSQDAGYGIELLRLDEFIYDGNTDVRQPVGPLGEVRTVRHWDSKRQAFLETRIEYDATGLVRRTVDPEGLWIETHYDGDYHAFPERVCSTLGCVTSKWDERFGVETSRIDLDNLETVYDYDPHGRLVTTTTPDGGKTSSFLLAHGIVTGAMNLRQRARVEIKDNSAGDGVLWSETLLDGFGRPYRTIKEGGATQTREYSDASSRPSRVSEVFSGTPLRLSYTTYKYDALGRMIEQRAPDGSLRQWAFRSDEVDTIDELGRKRTLAVDGRTDVIAVTERWNGADLVTQYGYDAVRHLIGTADHLGNTTSYYYDTLGQLISESDPDRGKREYSYYRNGRVHIAEDAKRQQIEYRYDTAGRPETRTDRDANGRLARTVTWIYDELPGAGPQGASRGRVVRVEDVQSNTRIDSTFHYDAGGRVDRDERCIDGTCLAMGYRFDVAGRLDQLTYPDANNAPDEVVDQAYDDAGRLVRVGGYLVDAKYTIDGLSDWMKVGNGIETKWTRDPARRWIDAIAIGGTYQATYKRDLGGTIRYLEEDAPTGKLSYKYDYDDLGRLTDATASSSHLDRHFTYDEIGRITSHSEHGAYYYDDQKHAHAVTRTDRGSERQYDANGNTSYLRDPSGREIEIQWTVDDRPAQFSGPNGRYEMAYDVTGARVKKSGSTNASYFHPHVTVENSQLVKYYFAGELLLARQEAGKLSYYHQDHVRAVRATTDENGAVVNSYRFDAFGAPLARNVQNADDVAFGTVHGDSDLDLVYMNARYYDPIVARFLSSDSVVRDAYAPQSLDRYAYVEGDPVNYIDPSGHMRRDVELMKERKESWRSLMVEFEKRSQEWCEPFCAKAITSTVVMYNSNGEIAMVWRPGDDADLAMEAWAFIQEMGGPDNVFAPEAPVPTNGGVGYGGGAGGIGAGGGGGGGGGSFTGGAVKPVDGWVSMPKGTSMAVDVEGTGEFAGTTVSFAITTNKYGTVTSAKATCSGDCPETLPTIIQGNIVAVELTRANGTLDITLEKQATSTRTTVKHSEIDGSHTTTVNGDIGGKVKKVLDGKLGGSFGLTLGGKRHTTNTNEHKMYEASTTKIVKALNPTKQTVRLMIQSYGPDPIEIIHGIPKRK